MAKSALRIGTRWILSRNIFEKTTRVACTQTNQNKLNPLQNVFITREMCSKTYTRRSDGTKAKKDDFSDSESDYTSDDEQKGDSMFWRRKMRTLHNHLDVNKDGVISYDDFMLLVDRFSELGHLSSKGKQQFQEVVNNMWKEQWGEISPYNLICVEKYLEEMRHVRHDKSLKKKCHQFLPFLFQAIDKDQSGKITVEEFKLFFKCLGLTQDDAVAAFCHIDTNCDGTISSEEFLTLGRDFFLTTDETRPSKYFWGPLID